MTTLTETDQIITSTNAPSDGPTPNPFGNSLQFLEVAYVDQLKVAPPSLLVPSFTPAPTTITQDGLTLELWFKAESPGSLVSVTMSNGSGTANAPLIYIDTNGRLRAGLFDSTPVTLLAGQNLIAQTNSNGVINVGAPNNLSSPLSVVDSQWHHAALVVPPGANATQSLFLDGRLAATNTANGSFGLSFVSSDGTTWTAETPAQTIFGGSITPQPVDSPPAFQPYPQSFSGCLNELRTWYGPRSATGIQQLIDQPLLPELSVYQQEGLAGYAGQSLFNGIQTSTYLVTTSDAPPVDPFTGIDRVPGFQNYGICTAIPFTTVALQVTFQTSQTYSTKISLCQTDQLQISFPKNQANGDDLPAGTLYSINVTCGSGDFEFSSGVLPGTALTIQAPFTDCFRLDFTCTAAVTIDNLQFMVIPGPVNTLMQLLLDVVPGEAAYTDPNYPITPTTVIDQESKQPVTLSPYWPLFTDSTVFPIDPTKYSAADLLSTYLNFNQQAREVPVPSGATFYDFLDLSANHATICEPSDLSTLLAGAYRNITGSNPPSSPPQAPFNTSIDQIYAFIYNVNAMRNTLNEFLTAYKGWAQVAINELALANIPSSVANEIYNGQEQVEAQLKGPSAGNFIGELLVSSAIVGLGAVLGPLILPAATVGLVSVTTVSVAALGSAGANVLSEIMGAFWTSSSVQAKMSGVNYETLEDVVNNVSADSASAYQVLITNLLDPAYLQTLFSNYGLLQAVSFVSAQPLYDVNNNAIQPGKNNSLITGTTYASWKALIPSVFTWSPQQLGTGDLSSNTAVFMVTQGGAYSLPHQPNPTIPSSLSVSDVLQNDPWKAFYWMLAQVQQWQTGVQGSPWGGQFFSICPIFYYGGEGQELFEYAADWAIQWSLRDTNQKQIANSVLTSLFGVGSSKSPLSLADQNNPFAAAGFGWYCQLAKNGVTTPIDAFMNWGEGVPSYSPQLLLTQFPDNGQLYPAQVQTSLLGSTSVQFASCAAADLPPAALVTLAPSALSFGNVAVGSNSKLTAVIANTQQNSLQNITGTVTGSSDFTVTGAPTELDSGQTATITVEFAPTATTTGLQSGNVTYTTQGQYGQISLNLAFSGTGVKS